MPVATLIEGKRPVRFDGYRFLALNAVKATKDFKCSMFAHLFLLLCWNLMARSASVWAYAHQLIQCQGSRNHISFFQSNRRHNFKCKLSGIYYVCTIFASAFTRVLPGVQFAVYGGGGKTLSEF